MIMRPDSLLRLWRYLNHLLTYLLTYLLITLYKKCKPEDTPNIPRTTLLRATNVAKQVFNDFSFNSVRSNSAVICNH